MAITQSSAAIFLTTRSAPTAVALEDDIYLTLPVTPSSGGEISDINVFLTADFALRTIEELRRAVEAAARAAP